MLHRKPLFALLLALVLGLVLSACSPEDGMLSELSPEFHKGKVYTAELEPLNGSGAEGEARVSFKGNLLTVDLQAAGLLADATHLSHIHGFTSASSTAECPTMANDTDGDGYVSLIEGAPVYGPILVTVGGAGVDTGSVINDQPPYRTFTETNSGGSIASIMPLSKKHIVVHGVDVDGDGVLDLQKDVNGDGVIGSDDNPVLNLTETLYELTMPALCGEISN